MQATVEDSSSSEDESSALEQEAQDARAAFDQGSRTEREEQRSGDNVFRRNKEEYFRGSTSDEDLQTKEDKARRVREESRLRNMWRQNEVTRESKPKWSPEEFEPSEALNTKWRELKEKQEVLRVRQEENTKRHVAPFARQKEEDERNGKYSTAEFTYNWIGLHRSRYWDTSSPAIRILTLLLGLAISWVGVSYTYRLLLGWVYYNYSHYRASNGYDVIVDGCYRARNERTGFWDRSQTHVEWFFLQGCLGVEKAGEGEEGMSTIARVYARLIADPFESSPGIYLIVLSLVLYFILLPLGRKLQIHLYFLLLPLCRNLCRNLHDFVFYPLGKMLQSWPLYAWKAGKGSWGKILSMLLIIYIAFKFIYRFTNLIIVAALGIIGIITYNYYNATPRSSLPKVHNVQRRQSVQHTACVHVVTCHCFAEKDKIIAALRDQQTALETQLSITQKYLPTEKQRNKRLEPNGDYWARMYRDLNSSFTRLVSERGAQEALHQREMSRLQSNVNYTTSTSLDTANATNELHDARSTIRNLERERNTLSMAGMALRQELAKEKESHSEKCQNESGCQRRIRELEENYDRIMSHMREDQFLVTDACIKLGMDAKEAEHVHLRAYLAEVTIKLAQLYTLGVPGADTSDLQVEIMRKEVSREGAYKNRLERELERIGGNVLDVRMGLDTTRPQDWKTGAITWEDNLLRVFPIYQRLWQVIIDMTEVYAREDFALPSWYHQATRDDVTTVNSELPPTEANMTIFIKSYEFANPHILQFEVLIEKLITSEFQRLYNRGLQLLSFLDSSTNAHATIFGIEHVNQILNEVLHDVLDSAPAILHDHHTELALSPRKQEKFKIYSAMQHSITSLNHIILSNKRVPPPWLTTAGLDDRFSKPYSSAENLSANLSNHEIVILAKRIAQLVAYTEEYALPGTKGGPPNVQHQHDPSYPSRWLQMTQARTYAELAVSYWNIHKDQREVLFTDPAGRQMVTMEPNNRHLHPLDLKMFNRTLMEMEEGKTDEGKWNAHLIDDPMTGPAIIFVPPGSDTNSPAQPSSYNDQNNHNNSKNNNGNNNNNNNNTSKADIRDRLTREWVEAQERAQQLYNWVVHYGIKGTMPRFRPESLRSNADPDKVRREIEALKELQNQYTHAMQGGYRKYDLPKWIRKGGRMNP